MDEQSLNEAIVSLVTDSWKRGDGPLLLSQLGAGRDGDISREVKARAVGLNAYVQENLTDQVRIVVHSTNSVRVAAIPRTSETDAIEDTDSLFEKRRVRPTKKQIRFHLIFWTAFRKSLPTGQRRFLYIGDDLSFRDVGSTEDHTQSDDCVEIKPEFASANGEDVSDEVVYKNILRWAADVGIDVGRFSHGVVLRRHSGVTAGSILERMFHVLGEEELRRVSMPLDLVKKLIEKS